MGRPVSLFGASASPNDVMSTGAIGAAAKRRASTRCFGPRKSQKFLIGIKKIENAGKIGQGMRLRKNYAAATPLIFVALFMIDYRKIYGVRFEQLAGDNSPDHLRPVEGETDSQKQKRLDKFKKNRRVAELNAAKIFEKSFNKDPVAFGVFYEWCIARERSMFERASRTGATYTRMHWRSIFDSENLFQSWRLELQRMGKQIPFQNINIEGEYEE